MVLKFGDAWGEQDYVEAGKWFKTFLVLMMPVGLTASFVMGLSPLILGAAVDQNTSRFASDYLIGSILTPMGSIF